MKKFIINSILFIPVAFLGYWILLSAWGEMMDERNHKKLNFEVHIKLHNFVSWKSKSNLNYPIAKFGHTLSRLNDAKKAKAKRVLFLGSSFAYRGFDNRFFRQNGISSFNLGSSAQTPIQTELLLQRYLDNIQPKIVVFEVSPGMTSNSGEEASIDIIANDIITPETINMALKVNRLKTYNTLLYGYYRQCFNRNDYINEHRWRAKDVYHRDGYVESKRDGLKKKVSIRNRKFKPKPKQLAALDRIIALLKHRKIPYYLVMAPKTKAVYSTYTNIDEHIALMKTKGRFYNFQNVLPLEDSIHFFDYYHLNQKGVIIFNQKVIDTLGLVKKN